MGMLLRRHNMANASNDNKQAEITSKPAFVVEETQPVMDNIVEETTENKYTKTDINRMSKDDLVVLAIQYDIDSEMSGADIKKALIDKLGL